MSWPGGPIGTLLYVVVFVIVVLIVLAVLRSAGVSI